MLQPGATIGRYRIERLLGSGGMGEVYLAEDPELRRRVALKIFVRGLPGAVEARDQLLHEARAASSLSHPNVCTIFEVGDDDGRAFIAMEHVEGRGLDDLIGGQGLSAEQVVRYGVQIADGVAHAHENGVVHRDLKSANVVITGDGRAKVLDFGLASTVARGDDTATRDVTSAEMGKVSGTLAYMAPEVLRGQQADGRSDIWALGVVLFEGLAGRLPFAGDTAFETSTAIMKETADIPAEAPPGLRSVIQRCLQKAPGERYQSAAEVRAALEMLQSGSSSTDVLPDEVVAAARVGARRGPWPLVGGALFFVLLAMAGWLAFGPSGGDESDAGGTSAGAAIGASGRPTVAVLPFRDHTASQETEWLSDGVPSMLLTSLAQTPGLDVVSNTRVQEIVAQLGRDSVAELDPATLAEFATRSGAGAVVVGDLYYTGSEYRFDVQVEDVRGGRVLSAYSATGPFVFELVDELSSRIRDGLDLEGTMTTVSIAEMRTDSAAAMVAYDRGILARQNNRTPDAINAFEQALDHDPELVMAHFQLADLSFFLPNPAEAEAHEAYVRENLHRLPERDRLYVEANFAIDAEDYDGAAALFEDLVSRYPDHEYGWLRLVEAYGRSELGFNERQLDAMERGVAAIPASGPLHNQLGYALLDRGRYTEAVRAIERYVELYPEEPNAYDSLAEVFTVSGQPERGLEKYTEILDIDPTWAYAYFGRAMTLAMLGRYDEALEEIEKYQEIAVGAGVPMSSYGITKGFLLAKLGRYREAMSLFEADIEVATRLGFSTALKSSQMAGVEIALEAGDYDKALELAALAGEDVEEVEIPAARRSIEYGAKSLAGIAHLRRGEMDAARRVQSELEEAAAEDQADLVFNVLRGEIALAAGDLDAAEAAFRAVEPALKATYSASTPAPTLFANNSHLRDDLARAAVARGDLDQAIRRYRGLLTVDIGSKYTAFLDPRYILKLARLLDQTGQTDEAIDQYERFLELWTNADERFQPLIDEASRRVAALGG